MITLIIAGFAILGLNSNYGLYIYGERSHDSLLFDDFISVRGFRVFLDVSHARGCSAVTDTSFACVRE